MNRSSVAAFFSLAILVSSSAYGQTFSIVPGSDGGLFGSMDVSTIDQGGITFDGRSPAAEILLELTPGFTFSGGTAALSILDHEGSGNALDAGETADVFVSTNGIDFTPIGSVVGGVTLRELDFAGSSYRFVKFVNTASNWDGYDFDFVTASNVAQIPEPTAFGLAFGALAFLGLVSRRR